MKKGNAKREKKSDYILVNYVKFYAVNRVLYTIFIFLFIFPNFSTFTSPLYYIAILIFITILSFVIGTFINDALLDICCEVGD